MGTVRAADINCNKYSDEREATVKLVRLAHTLGRVFALANGQWESLRALDRERDAVLKPLFVFSEIAFVGIMEARRAWCTPTCRCAFSGWRHP